MARPVVFKFIGDAKKLKEEITASEAAMQRFGGKMQSVGTKMSIGLTAPLTALGVSSVNAAADLGEAVNLTAITFDKAEGKVSDFAKTTAKTLGQSERAAREATASFGGLLTNVGLADDKAADYSITLTTLASDLGSAFNTDPAEAVQALGSALRGESEPIRRYNVLLSDAAVRSKAVELGLAATTAEVDEQDKVLARYNLILEQTSKIQGDFANTSDSLSNQQRILKAQFEDVQAELGQRLLPVAVKMADVAIDLLEGFSDLPGPVKDVAVALGGVTAAAGPLLYLTGSLIRNAKELAPLFAKIPKGLVGPAAVTGAFYATAAAAKSLRQELWGLDAERFGQDFVEFAESGVLAGELLRGVGEDFDRFEKAVKRITDPTLSQRGLDFMSELTSLGVNTGNTDLEQSIELLEKLDDQLVQLSTVSPSAAGSMFSVFADNAAESGASVEEFLALLPRYRDLLNDTELATDDAAGATGDLTGGLVQVEGAADDAEAELDKFRNTLQKIIGIALDADAANIRYIETLGELEAELTEGGKTFAFNTEEGRKNRQAFIDAADAALRHAQAVADETGEVDAANAILRDHIGDLRAVGEEAGFTAAEMDALLERYRLIPSSITTVLALRTEGFDAALEQLNLLRAESGLPALTGTSQDYTPPAVLGHSVQNTYNVNVANPTGETAEDTLNRELRRANLYM